MNDTDIKTRENKERKGAGIVGLLLRLGVPNANEFMGLRAVSAALLGTKTGFVAVALATGAAAAGAGLIVTSEPYTHLRAGGGVFAAKSADAPSLPDAAHPEAYASAEGVSTSLDKFNQANQGAVADGDATAAASAESAAAEQTAAADSGVGVPDNNIALSGGGSGAPAGRPALKKAKSNFNPSSGKGGSGATFKSGAERKKASTQGRTLASAAGVTSGLRGGGARSKITSRARSGARGGGKSASRQAVTTRSVTRGAMRGPNLSSQNSGATYDGGRGAQGSAGAQAGLPTASGVGAAPEGISSKPNPQTVGNLNRATPKPAPVKKAKNKTPYQDLATLAMAAMALGGIVLMAGALFKQWGDSAATAHEKASWYEWAQIMGGIAMFLGGLALAVGLFISGQSGQLMQGAMYMAGGGIIAIAGAFMMMDSSKAEAANAQAKSNAQHALKNSNAPTDFKNGTVQSVDSNGLATVKTKAGKIGQLQLNTGQGAAGSLPAPDTSTTGTWQGATP